MCVFFILFHLYTVQKLSILSVIRVKVMLQCRSRIHGPLYLHIYHNFLYSLEIKSQWQERLGIPSKLVVQAISQNFMKPLTSFMLQHISPGSKLIFIPEFPNIQIRLGERYTNYLQKNPATMFVSSSSRMYSQIHTFSLSLYI